MARLIIVSFIFAIFPISLASAEPAVTSPNSLPETKTFIKAPLKIAYVEAGPYHDYKMNLIGLASALEKLGLIENGHPPDSDSETAKSIWDWLSRKAGGHNLIFRADNFYSAQWDESKLIDLKREILAKAEANEINLILAFGTSAGKLLATSDHQTPVLSITATDPVAAGISKTPERSGLDHVHVQVPIGQIERQLSIFHNVFGFKTLGVPYDTTAAGMSTMGVSTIERMSQELGFKIVPCQTELEISDSEQAFANLVGCLKRLSLESEAIYLTVSNGMIDRRMPEILAPMVARGLPTFSQRGPVETKLGILMSLAENNFMSSGQFEAEVIYEILNGRSPGDINQIYVPPLTMALNIKMAMAIGWNPPLKVLAAVDELYTTMAVNSSKGSSLE
ncbi:MAG: ABC transporter substrate-binding protein [Deltaproteobacteria bacterium]|nr:ABC transporter substrate-binding protein [Deltaproteobacteria bacterium]